MQDLDLCSLKKQLRNEAKNIRKSLDIQSISEAICDKFVCSEFYKDANEIFVYHSYHDEVCTHSLLLDTSKMWIIPFVQGDSMFASRYDKANLKKNTYGIVEVSGFRKILDSEIDMIILPALMVDKQGYRLGYGKGYYDKFLRKVPRQILKVAFIPECLFVDRVPAEDHDQRCDVVVTENKICYCK